MGIDISCMKGLPARAECVDMQSRKMLQYAIKCLKIASWEALYGTSEYSY